MSVRRHGKNHGSRGREENIARWSITKEDQWISTPLEQGGHILILAPVNSEPISGAVSYSDGGALMGSTMFRMAHFRMPATS